LHSRRPLRSAIVACEGPAHAAGRIITTLSGSLFDSRLTSGHILLETLACICEELQPFAQGIANTRCLVRGGCRQLPRKSHTLHAMFVIMLLLPLLSLRIALILQDVIVSSVGVSISCTGLITGDWALCWESMTLSLIAPDPLRALIVNILLLSVSPARPPYSLRWAMPPRNRGARLVIVICSW
jgi:hypothetical protein